MKDLTVDECLRLLDEGRVAHVACIAEGQPYVTPMSYVMLGGLIHFRTALGRRVDALRRDPRLSISVASLGEGGSWRSVLVAGLARIIEDPAVEADVIAALIHKYGESPLAFSRPAVLPKARPVVAVDPSETTGRASGDPLGPGIHPGRV
ncbi:MAG TPA: pyridoxamine 5'-phosphate oxidase family protein [Acidimicrobiia bacterium]|nr:pyridoxamine 5'-phosphate oxidase family protein [Acidimicrobiia bacterium]